MSNSPLSALISLCVGILLLSAVLMVWRHSLRASIRLLATQGVVLAALVTIVGIFDKASELFVVATIVLGLKGILLPWLLSRQLPDNVSWSQKQEAELDDAPRLNPTAALVVTAILISVAYAVFSPLMDSSRVASAHAAPAGIGLVFIGFLLLATRRRARGQLIGFLVLDNGIATVAFLISGGVPLLVELGASLDVLLVVLILQVFTRRMGPKFGSTSVDQLRELHD